MFELVDAEETIWNVLATDVDFGPDGAIYVSDWVNGWNGEGKGRIYRFAVDRRSRRQPRSKQVQKLLAEGFAQRLDRRAGRLLAHADRRVRQEAQFALVEQQATTPLARRGARKRSQLARIHAIWGLGQLARRGSITPLPEAGRQQSVGRCRRRSPRRRPSMLGDVRHDSAGDELRRRSGRRKPAGSHVRRHRAGQAARSRLRSSRC